MPDLQSSDPVTEAHERARVLSRRGAIDSVRATVPFIGWFTAFSGGITSALVAADKLEMRVFYIALVAAPAIFGLICFAAIEFTRLTETAAALRELVRAYIYYDDLLTTARRAKDEADKRAADASADKFALQSVVALLSYKNGPPRGDTDAES
jgi:hypothetical protein